MPNLNHPLTYPSSSPFHVRFWLWQLFYCSLAHKWHHHHNWLPVNPPPSETNNSHPDVPDRRLLTEKMSELVKKLGVEAVVTRVRVGGLLLVRTASTSNHTNIEWNIKWTEKRGLRRKKGDKLFSNKKTVKFNVILIIELTAIISESIGSWIRSRNSSLVKSW